MWTTCSINLFETHKATVHAAFVPRRYNTDYPSTEPVPSKPISVYPGNFLYGTVQHIFLDCLCR